jgi:hypothetical protein
MARRSAIFFSTSGFFCAARVHVSAQCSPAESLSSSFTSSREAKLHHRGQAALERL